MNIISVFMFLVIFLNYSADCDDYFPLGMPFSVKAPNVFTASISILPVRLRPIQYAGNLMRSLEKQIPFLQLPIISELSSIIKKIPLNEILNTLKTFFIMLLNGNFDGLISKGVCLFSEVWKISYPTVKMILAKFHH